MVPSTYLPPAGLRQGFKCLEKGYNILFEKNCAKTVLLIRADLSGQTTNCVLSYSVYALQLPIDATLISCIGKTWERAMPRKINTK